MNNISIILLVFLALLFVVMIFTLSFKSYNLNSIKSKTVGNGQHGTARFATKKEINQTYQKVKYDVKAWRQGLHLPTYQGIITSFDGKYAYVDCDDVHALMIGAAGVGKTAHFLYPNLEYACACGMSLLTTDTKGDLFRNYATIASKYYHYNISVIDLRNPTRSNEFNMLYLVNRYIDAYLQDTSNLRVKAKAERYAKIIAKTIIYSNGSDINYGQNQFFYDSAEGLLTATILIISEFAKKEQRHIVSVFKLIQDLLAPSDIKGQSEFKSLLDKFPDDHKAKWFAGSALNTSEQSMQSILATALARLNSFIDSELEQILCFATDIDAETFCKEKSAIFLVMPEEDNTKYFIISLIIQQLYREILSVADEMGGQLQNRTIFFLDEIGTFPKIESAEMMFSASRSRKLSIVAIIQSLAQLEKNYGKEGSDIIVDNTQLSIFGGFAPNSQTAEVMSKNLGSKTVLSGTVSKNKNDPSPSLQMMERALMSPYELKAMAKGQFIVMKTGTHPMKSSLSIFYKWNITFDSPYSLVERSSRIVSYASKDDINNAVQDIFQHENTEIKKLKFKKKFKEDYYY